MSQRENKLYSLGEAVSLISDGSRVAFGGFAVYQKPMAAVREIIRQDIKHLTVVGTVNSLDVDMLCGAGCIDTVETSYVGMEKYGLAQNYRRAVQNGAVQVIHYPELLAWDRFRADREGFPYWPVYSLGGTDIVKENKEIIEYTCPVTGKPVWALPAAKPDIVVIHAWRGDKYGNVQIQPRYMLPQYQDIDFARACNKLIVTVEELIDNSEIQRSPHLTMIPAFRTTKIIHAPHGSHPTATLQESEEDTNHFKIYAEAAKTDDKFKEYLEIYVKRPSDLTEYYGIVTKDR